MQRAAECGRRSLSRVHSASAPACHADVREWHLPSGFLSAWRLGTFWHLSCECMRVTHSPDRDLKERILYKHCNACQASYDSRILREDMVCRMMRQGVAKLRRSRYFKNLRLPVQPVRWYRKACCIPLAKKFAGSPKKFCALANQGCFHQSAQCDRCQGRIFACQGRGLQQTRKKALFAQRAFPDLRAVKLTGSLITILSTPVRLRKEGAFSPGLMDAFPSSRVLSGLIVCGLFVSIKDKNVLFQGFCLEKAFCF